MMNEEYDHMPKEDIERSLRFETFLRSRRYSMELCRSYTHVLMHPQIRSYMVLYYRCATVYHLTNIEELCRFIKNVEVKNQEFTTRLQLATKLYIEFLAEDDNVKSETGELEKIAMGDLFASSDYMALKETIKNLKSELSEARRERYEANMKLREAEAKVAEYEKSKSEEKIVDHEEVVVSVFCEIAQRYMESTKRKRTDQRTLVKNSLHDIMSQLKMFGRIPNDLQKCINNFDDETTPVIPHVIVQGDYVLQKHVDGQVNHVDDGGTGISRQ